MEDVVSQQKTTSTMPAARRSPVFVRRMLFFFTPSVEAVDEVEAAKDLRDFLMIWRPFLPIFTVSVFAILEQESMSFYEPELK